MVQLHAEQKTVVQAQALNAIGELCDENTGGSSMDEEEEARPSWSPFALDGGASRKDELGHWCRGGILSAVETTGDLYRPKGRSH